jgi:hypothetical protein
MALSAKTHPMPGENPPSTLIVPRSYRRWANSQVQNLGDA